jgi:hypothetical protein
MKLMLHIVAKDLRRIRWILVMWAAFLLLRTAAYASMTGFIGEPGVHWLQFFNSPVGSIALPAFDGLVVYLLVAAMVYEDSPTVRDAFWVTRPQAAACVFGAKVLAAGVVAVLIPTITHLPWWLRCGATFGTLPSLMGAVAVTLGAAALLAVCVASLTDGFPRFVLWTIMGAAIVFTLMLVVRWIGSKFGVSSHAIIYPVWLISAVFAAITLAPAAHQYLTRRLARSIGWLGFGVAALTSVMTIAPPKFRPSSAVSLYREEAVPLALKIPGVPSHIRSTNRLLLPLEIENARDNEALWAKVRAKWTWENGREHSSVSAGFLVPPRWTLTRMYNLGNGKAITQTLHFGSQVANVAADDPPAMTLDAELVSVFATEAGRMPVVPGASVSHKTGRYEISTVRPRGRDVELQCVSTSSLTRRFSRIHDVEYVMVNPRDRSAVHGHPVGFRTASLGFVQVAVQNLAFRLPKQPGWLEDVELVAVVFSEARTSRAQLAVPSFKFESLEFPPRVRR